MLLHRVISYDHQRRRRRDSRNELFLGEFILAERGGTRKTKTYGLQGAPRVLTVGFRMVAAANPTTGSRLMRTLSAPSKTPIPARLRIRATPTAVSSVGPGVAKAEILAK
jgi:hypothetical protein